MKKLTTLNEYMARLPQDEQNQINAKAQKLKQAYELSQLRQTANLSQSQLADKMGVSQANISKIENGGDVQLSTLQKYVTALGGKLAVTATMDNGQVIAIMWISERYKKPIWETNPMQGDCEQYENAPKYVMMVNP